MLIILLTWKGCGREKQIITVKVPVVQGEFNWQESTLIPNKEPAKVVYLQGRPFPVENPVNDSLLAIYNQTKDSLKRARMYIDAIQIREYKNHFEDEYLKADVFSKVQGYSKGVRLEYEIKERKITQEIESTRLRLLFGGKIGVNQDLDSFIWEVDAAAQNAKGNIIEASYLRLNKQNYGLIGGKFSIFNIK
ncbi:hypothetical protein C7S20_00060 [Christiangramia fulva]|uniref:Uncharacterized protein n=2 Tax=Christiangramia fulva TaxID=2126553 RepID=A0A2R3Z0K2_9FLAO|nr:hypothetical protein C7S20_00060 [Christiangramia fulva]